ncbi:Protein CBG21113 [Caenorhabditis briggsae]|uniref:Protein CBG21113 n=1 Tax=Caenorhabditis briggsae TaxID=6238 RepID=A8XZG4_CAEBR|nr:Protein CBG21113 [Caenorhabditis briggsae]CAP38091.1 Protein CBG21113 [Caenorhabditis briggsae]
MIPVSCRSSHGMNCLISVPGIEKKFFLHDVLLAPDLAFVVPVDAPCCRVTCISRRRASIRGAIEEGPRTQDPGPRTQDPGPRTQDPGPRTQDPGPRTQDPGPRTQDPGPRTQVPGPRTQDPGPRTQDPGSPLWSPEKERTDSFLQFSLLL